MRLTDAEWQIMNALWEKYPASAREISGRLPENVKWAYTTIKTMLGRLVAKEAVQESKQGNTSYYEPLVTRSKARGMALKSLLNQAFDGALGPMMHFLVEEENLSEKQRAELVEVLRKRS